MASVFVFESHQEIMSKMLAVMPKTGDELNVVCRLLDVAVLYLYSGAAAMLLTLASCYWFGKLHKSKYEFGRSSRIFVGFTMLVIEITLVLGDKIEKGFRIAASKWIITIVVIVFAVSKFYSVRNSEA